MSAQTAFNAEIPIQKVNSRHRLQRKLRDALGETICKCLDDPLVTEIMLNPDGQLFVERLGEPMARLGSLDSKSAETIIGAVAHSLETEARVQQPIISGELPLGGHRFEGLLFPVVSSPVFSIRKRATRIFSLDNFIASAILTAEQGSFIRHAVVNRLNIVVAGGTGSGKTTLANAVLAEIANAAPDHRLVIIEDTAELQCASANTVQLHTSEFADMARLLKSTMRLRPDRIVVGEVRDGAALTLLKAWNTGHPGGITTVHSNSAVSALTRLEQLVSEVSATSMPQVIAQAIDVVIFIERDATGRRVSEILHVTGFKDGAYQVANPLEISRGSSPKQCASMRGSVSVHAGGNSHAS